MSMNSATFNKASVEIAEILQDTYFKTLTTTLSAALSPAEMVFKDQTIFANTGSFPLRSPSPPFSQDIKKFP